MKNIEEKIAESLLVIILNLKDLIATEQAGMRLKCTLCGKNDICDMCDECVAKRKRMIVAKYLNEEK